jgi:hypothetical protein
LIPLASPISAPPDLSKILKPLIAATQSATAPVEPDAKRRGTLDVSAAITRALTAAGLMK